MNSKVSSVAIIMAILVASTAAKSHRMGALNSLATRSLIDFDCSGKVDGNYPHPSKCTHYVACVAQTYAYEMQCAISHDGKPLHYVQDSGPNPETSRCDYPEIAKCGGQVCTCSNKAFQAEFSYDCSGKADGNYPHPTKCTHYVACVAQTYAYEMQCALNLDGKPLHYVADSGPDPATSRCDYPEVAGCDCSC